MFDAKASQPDVEIDSIIWLNLRIRMTVMQESFKIGEHVRWNSEAGRVSGLIIKKITSDMRSKGTCITPRVKRHNISSRVTKLNT
jgi:hypothetical protein